MKKIIFLSLLVLFSNLILSQTNESNSVTIDTTLLNIQNDTLIVGLKMSPPFTMKDEAGNFSGVSIDLWEEIAVNLGVKFIYKEYDLKHLLIAVKNREIDLCISPLTVTSDRLKVFNFTQPFYLSNISIAVKGKKKSFIIMLLSNLFSLNFLKAILALFGVIFILGILLWFAERRKNEQVAENIKGIGDGIWWAAVTMTTVGYGDKAPVTPLGRSIAFFWMFLSIVIISSLTASITTALTMERISTNIEELKDLDKVNTGTVTASSTEAYLVKRGINVKGIEDIETGMKMLEKGEIDAFVYDEPILRYIIQKNKLNETIRIIEDEFNSQYYSFSLPTNHKLLDYINPLLIREMDGVGWKETLNRYNLPQR